jgi:putative MATE family efflux protein
VRNGPAGNIGERWSGRAIFALLWPLVIEQLLAVTMGAADTIMVGSVGEHAVSGVNIVDNINNLLIIAFTALATGGAVVVSQYIGRGEPDNSRLASKQLLYIVTVIALVVTAPVLPLRRLIVRLLYGRLEEEVMAAAAVYFLITAASYPFLAVYNANAALFRAVGNSRIPMLTALLVNVLNIGGNALFVFVFRIGVAGVALSTLVSRAAAALLTFLLLLRGGGAVSLAGITRVRFSRPVTRSILRVGVPGGLENSMFQIGRLLTQRIFPVFGTAAMAGNAIAGVINSFSFMPGSAFGLALLTVVGQCVGAGDFEEAKRQTARIMKMAFLTILVMNSLIFLFMEGLVGLFHLSSPAHDYAMAFLRVHCVSMAAGWTMSFVLPSALRAAGDARYVMIAAAVSMWTVRVSAAYLLTYAAGIGPLGVWLAMGADFLVRGACYHLRWVRGKWRTKKVIG